MTPSAQIPFDITTSPVALVELNVDMIAFYFPGTNTAWDDFYGCPFMGNFWVLPGGITITASNGGSGTFKTAEAAFRDPILGAALRASADALLLGQSALHRNLDTF